MQLPANASRVRANSSPQASRCSVPWLLSICKGVVSHGWVRPFVITRGSSCGRAGATPIPYKGPLPCWQRLPTIGVRSKLRSQLESQGIAFGELVPHLGDFNDDLRAFGRDALRRSLLGAMKAQGLEIEDE
ncbi:hypothetical protein PXK63_18245 [Phaeobacter gallaeciensis]|nr:hypothetical protein [Phaeobacter gallaeciensis]MDE4171872.1 hypothetical protein [Phaeobacter gallaeciensis]MDE4213787.1 hypothetical protein [Phaeobacter gallaeciensis]